MPLRMEPLEEPNLILTPIIDIMLLLLIFFMVGTQFVEDEQSYDIRLPTASETASVASPPDPATVNIGADGAISLEGAATTVADLESRLVALRENYPGQVVLIRGDGAVAYQQIMDVLASVKRAGITGVSLASRPVPQE